LDFFTAFWEKKNYTSWTVFAFCCVMCYNDVLPFESLLGFISLVGGVVMFCCAVERFHGLIYPKILDTDQNEFYPDRE